MQLISFITSLINIGANSSWTVHPVLNIFMMIDGLIYRLVSYAFNVFLIMCSVNFNTLYGIVAPLLDRLKAVIMVLVLFKVGVALIQYMVTPDKAMSEGTNILKNIVIVAVLLVSYQFVFNVLNELGMLIMGNPTGYPYTTLSTIADVTAGEDEGLIMRALFGADKEKVGDVGDYLAFSTLSIFIHDYNNPESSTVLKKEICSSEGCDFGKVHNLSSKVDKTIEYIWGLSGLVGLFLIYSIGKAAIEIGVRMFKLVILQMLAPVAIITIIDKGWGSSTWKAYLSKYGQVYIEAFTRMLFMLITTVFVCKFFVNIGDFFGNLSDVEGKFTKGLITIIVIISAYKIGGSIPKFIGEALGKNIGGSDANFVGGLLGAGVGALTGAVGGFAGGGLGGAISGAAGGLINGAQSGSKGNNVAEFFKGQGQVGSNQKKRAAEIAAAGGGLAYMKDKLTTGFDSLSDGRNARYNHGVDEEMKSNQKAMDKLDKEMAGYQSSNSQMDEIEASIEEAAKGTTFRFEGADASLGVSGSEEFSWDTSDEDIISRDQGYRQAQAQEQALRSEIQNKTYSSADDRKADIEKLQRLQDNTKAKYKEAQDAVKAARDRYRDQLAASDPSISSSGLATVADRKAQRKTNDAELRRLGGEKRELQDKNRELEDSKRKVTNSK